MNESEFILNENNIEKSTLENLYDTRKRTVKRLTNHLRRFFPSSEHKTRTVFLKSPKTEIVYMVTQYNLTTYKIDVQNPVHFSNMNISSENKKYYLEFNNREEYIGERVDLNRNTVIPEKVRIKENLSYFLEKMNIITNDLLIATPYTTG